MEYIDQQAKLEAEEVARSQYIKEMLKLNKDFDQSVVQRDDYADLAKKPEMAITSLGSTRGGLTSSLNRMAKSSFGIKSLFASELG